MFGVCLWKFGKETLLFVAVMISTGSLGEKLLFLAVELCYD